MRVRLAILPPPLEPELVALLLGSLPPPLEAGAPSMLEVDVERLRDPIRNQVDAALLLDQLPAPGPRELLLALTGRDLFLSALTYVFGVSRLGERRGLLSWFRLEAERPLFGRRLVIEATHELGHALGLVHCPVGDCAMHRTLWPEGIELKRPAYCPTCLESARRLAGWPARGLDRAG